jgi:NAD(P)-dependent dehydrogenase (short-subunit alcohol dehydrogenase family)
MTTLEKKTVLITGGTSGIGKATALAFAKEGANVAVAGLRVAEGEQVAREITSTGGRALFVQTDVIREDEIIALIEKTVATLNRLLGCQQADLALDASVIERDVQPAEGSWTRKPNP